MIPSKELLKVVQCGRRCATWVEDAGQPRSKPGSQAARWRGTPGTEGAARRGGGMLGRAPSTRGGMEGCSAGAMPPLPRPCRLGRAGTSGVPLAGHRCCCSRARSSLGAALQSPSGKGERCLVRVLATAPSAAPVKQPCREQLSVLFL